MLIDGLRPFAQIDRSCETVFTCVMYRLGDYSLGACGLDGTTCGGRLPYLMENVCSLQNDWSMERKQNIRLAYKLSHSRTC